MSTLTIETARVFKPLLGPHRDKAAHGGRGSGKSHFFATQAALTAYAKPGTRIVCVREIQKSLKESAKRLIEDKIEQHGLTGFRLLNDEIVTPGRGVIIFQGMQDHSAESIKSLEAFDVSWVEEAQTLSERSLSMLRPTIRKPGSERWWSWNRRRKVDPVDALFSGEHKPPNSVMVQANWRDNPWFPADLNTDRLYDQINSPDTYQHVWEGDYVGVQKGAYYAQQLARAKAEGRISRVVKDDLLELRAFWDLGVNDSTAIWIAQFVGREIRVLDYIEGQGQPLAYYVQALRGKGCGEALCVLPHDGAHRDSVMAVRFEDHLKDAGFRTQTIANSGKGAAMQRIETARRLFSSIWFNEAPTQAGRDALGWYHERKDESRQIGLGPEHDWCLAAGTQVLTPNGWRAVESLSVHDQVLTPGGPRLILRSGVVRMTSEWSNVRGIKCTPEHRFFTSRGLVEAGNLSSRDKLWTRGDLGLRVLGLWSATLCFGLKAAIISATPEARPAAGIACSYIGWCMRLCTARYRLATRFITSMMTRSTIIPTIWKPSLASTTGASTSHGRDMCARAGSVAPSSAAIRRSANAVVQSAGASTMPILSVNAEPAYNLTVDVDECYYARGVDGRAYLVSNSSHAADAFGLMCMAYELPKIKRDEARGYVETIGAEDVNTAWMGN